MLVELKILNKYRMRMISSINKDSNEHNLRVNSPRSLEMVFKIENISSIPS
jgi:hypothetical protein